MSQKVDQIRETLEHEHLGKIREFPQIAEDENYTTEYNGTDLNEAIARFEQIEELLETAIESDVIQILGNDQQKNIANRLQKVRKQASNIENRNSRRNNPGRDFINQVENLRAYVIGELCLDLRIGEHLEFTEKLAKIEEIREEHQKVREGLAQAEEKDKEIEDLLNKASDSKDKLDNIVQEANKNLDKLEKSNSQASSTLTNVEENAKTINERYEDVLKKTDQINKYEGRLEESLSEIEQRSEDLSQQQDDLDEVEGRINTLLNGAIAASLDRNFSERKEELERSAKIWAASTFIAIIGLVVGAYFIFINITSANGFGSETVSRVTLLIPLLVGVWFTSKNYSRKRRLMEEYAFKSTMAQTLEPSRKVLESQNSFDDSDAQLAEFMLVSMGQMFTNPSDIVDNGNSPTEGDATNIETVMDLARRIANN